MCKSNLRVIKTLNAIVESFADEKLMIKYDGERILQKFTIVFWHDASSEQLQTDNLYLQLESIWHRFHFDNLPIFEVFLKAVFLRWRRLVGDDAIVLITLNACVIDCSVIHKKISIFRYTGDVEGLLRETGSNCPRTGTPAIDLGASGQGRYAGGDADTGQTD